MFLVVEAPLPPHISLQVVPSPLVHFSNGVVVSRLVRVSLYPVQQIQGRRGRLTKKDLERAGVDGLVNARAQYEEGGRQVVYPRPFVPEVGLGEQGFQVSMGSLDGVTVGFIRRRVYQINVVPGAEVAEQKGGKMRTVVAMDAIR